MFLLTQPLLSLFGAAALAAPYPPPPQIDWYSIDCGGGTSSGGALVLQGTVGQPDAGPFSPLTMSGGPFNVVGGFMNGADNALCPADFNADGNLNADDLSDFITCYFMEAASPGVCPVADFNRDGDINPDDLSDYITAYFTGC